MIENNVPFVIHLVQIGVTDYPFSFSVQRGEDCLAVIETVGEISSQVQFVIRDSRENTLKIPIVL